MRTEVVTGTEAAKVIDDEEKILAAVLQRLVEYLAERSQKFADPSASVYQKARESLLELRNLIGEAKTFDLPALTEQMHHLAALSNHLDPKLMPPADPASPYFAHIRLYENNRDRDVLIGKRSFVDAKNRINIVDWRHAPVSRLYYTYDEGADYDIHYGDREVEGVLLLRRSLTILDGLLRRISTPNGQFIRNDQNGQWFQPADFVRPELKGGQGIAKRAPTDRPRFGTGDDRGYRMDKHLPEIAALIDPEQFERITQPATGLVILHGGAGSGKTTVALHRVAYLNYQDKNRYHGDKVLVTVFNRALARYIQKVLPALDVHDVRVWTYRNWSHQIRRQIFPGLPKKEWEDLPVAVSRLKKHPAMLKIMSDYIEDQTAAIAMELKERLHPSLFERWEKSGDLPLVPRLQKLHRFGIDANADVTSGLVLQKVLDRSKDLFTDWAEIVTDKNRLRKGLNDYGDTSVTDLQLDTVIHYCTRQTSVAAPDDERDEEVRPVDGEGAEADERGLLDSLDNTLLLRLCQLKYGSLVTPMGKEIFYNHSVIDEAQDLSPLEIRVVMDATNDDSLTLAGDTAQKLIFDNGFDDWDTLQRVLGKDAIQIKPLRIAYRSTHEINLFARAILGPLAPDEPVQSKRHGAPVEVFLFHQTGETLAFLTDTLRELMGRERQANVALLALTPQQADLYYEGLQNAEIHPLRRVRDQDFVFAPGIDVTDISQIKGLEYDYVIVLEATSENFPATNESRHLLHIAATRAAHQLWLVVTGKPSPLIPKESIVSI